MNAEQRRQAARMWKDGELVTKIARHFGVKVNHIYHLADRHRHQFPHRQFTVRRRSEDVPVPIVRKPKPGRMSWTTEGGAVVTLPRISMINCPRRTP